VLEGAVDNASVGLVLPRFKYPSHPERDALVIEEIMERDERGPAGSADDEDAENQHEEQKSEGDNE
jgi:hypothetical protein